jgi:PDZ domain-containing protein
MRVPKKLLVLVPLILVVVLGTSVWLPLYSVGPGPAREVEPLIRVSGHPTYPTNGKLVMTSVTFDQLTGLGALIAWLDPNQDVVPRSDLYAPGETVEQEHARAISQMDQSKLDATYVVLSELTGYPKEHRDGALVESTVPGCAADGELFPGDLIQGIDGEPVRGRASASRLIDAAPSGSSLAFDLRVDGKPESVELVRQPCGDSNDPLVGVSLIDHFPFDVSIESGDIGGPSAGLMWALGLYDLLTPGDLTSGRMIAGTGEIGLDGTIYPIGGIGEKIVAAERAGASAFLVPRANLAGARAADPDGMTLVPVSTFRDALDFLQAGSSAT